MISALLDRVTDVVLTPQAAVTDPTRRATVDTVGGDQALAAQAIQLAGSRTRPGPSQIGGRLLTLTHEIVVVVSVLFAKSQAETKARRDEIALDLVLRYIAADRDGQLDTDDERTTASTFLVDYGTLNPDTRNEYATLTFTVQTERTV